MIVRKGEKNVNLKELNIPLTVARLNTSWNASLTADTFESFSEVTIILTSPPVSVKLQNEIIDLNLIKLQSNILSFVKD